MAGRLDTALTPEDRDRRPSVRWQRLLVRLCVLLVAASAAVGCPCLREPINASPAIRWWLFSNFGAGRVCNEMLKRGVPLKLTPTGNTVGRFFPERCQHEVKDASQTIVVNFGGTGFAWTPIAGRVGFSAEASIEYRMDFHMTEDAVYVWARVQNLIRSPEFKIGSVENKIVDWAARTPVGYMAQTFGVQIVESQLAQGFTVIRTDEGDEFALGHLSPPQRPPRPFNTRGVERIVYANETTEIRTDQIDFLGPFEVPDSGQALFMRFALNGSPVDVLVLHRGTADLWRNGLQLGAALAPPPQPAIASFVVQPSPEQRQKVNLPPGQYYVVVDNSARMGTVAPAWNPLGLMSGSPVVLSYTVELGDSSAAF